MNSVIRVLIVGASGFVGSAIVESLTNSRDFEVAITSRRKTDAFLGCLKFEGIDLTAKVEWPELLENIDVVIYAAGIASASKRCSISDFYQVNALALVDLVSAASQVRGLRLIYLSSVKVHGECLEPGQRLVESDKVCPTDVYGMSKLLGEKIVQAAAGLDYVIIRLPPVYGSGMKGNFLRFLKFCRYSKILPFGSFDEQRSYIGLPNLCSFIEKILDPKYAYCSSREVFLVSDLESISTRDLAVLVSHFGSAKGFLISMPGWLTQLLTRLPVYGPSFGGLVSGCVVDISKARVLFDWSPPSSLPRQLSFLGGNFVE